MLNKILFVPWYINYFVFYFLFLSYVKLLLSSWKIYMCNFDGMVFQQIVGIPVGTNCAPLISDLFLYCYERVFMSKPSEIQTV